MTAPLHHPGVIETNVQGTNLRKKMDRGNKYLLLTEFEGRTISKDRAFPSSIYGPSAKRAGHKSKGKNEDP